MPRVLVTGGTGLVGAALHRLKPEWHYVGSKDYNLSCKHNCVRVLKEIAPDIVIHLAAKVGGLFKNERERLTMYRDNLQINENMISACYEYGCKRMICCLSTCVFPDGLNKVLVEEDLHKGEPHHSNYGYAFTKRMMEVHCRLVNETDGYHYQCIIPTNIYGPNDNFHLDDSHVIPGLIHRAFQHALINSGNDSENETSFVIKGDGTPKRQFIYSLDLARIIVILVTEKINEPLIICSPDASQTYTILEVAKKIARRFGIRDIVTEKKPENNGQYSKVCSNDLLMSLLPNFEFTPLSVGLNETIEWFVNTPREEIRI